jgi:hypothetical protein
MASTSPMMRAVRYSSDRRVRLRAIRPPSPIAMTLRRADRRAQTPGHSVTAARLRCEASREGDSVGIWASVARMLRLSGVRARRGGCDAGRTVAVGGLSCGAVGGIRRGASAPCGNEDLVPPCPALQP